MKLEDQEEIIYQDNKNVMIIIFRSVSDMYLLSKKIIGEKNIRTVHIIDQKEVNKILKIINEKKGGKSNPLSFEEITFKREEKLMKELKKLIKDKYPQVEHKHIVQKHGDYYKLAINEKVDDEVYNKAIAVGIEVSASKTLLKSKTLTDLISIFK